MFGDLKKIFKKNTMLSVVALAVLVIVLYNYSSSKSAYSEGNSAAAKADNGQAAPQQQQVQPAHPAGENEVSASVTGAGSPSLGLPPSCSKGSPATPGDLLPRTGDNAFSQLTPNLGNGDLTNVNLLDAGFHSGIDTVMGSLRNANLQVRSEPPNPQNKVSPWQNSTIEPDLMRVPLELGCGPQ